MRPVPAGVPPVAISAGTARSQFPTVIFSKSLLPLQCPVSAACQSPPCQRGVPRLAEAGGFPRVAGVHIGLYFRKVPTVRSLSHASGVPAPFSKGAILRPVSLLCRRLGFIPPSGREVAWGAAPRRREPAGAKAIGRSEAVPPQVCQVFGFDHTKASCKIGTGNR